MGNSIQSGVVLRYANYRDNDRMLTLFTREAGLVSVCARGCRRPKSPLAAAGEAFVYGEFSIFEGRGGKRMLDSFALLESFYPIREDIARLAGGSCSRTGKPVISGTLIPPASERQFLFSKIKMVASSSALRNTEAITVSGTCTTEESTGKLLAINAPAIFISPLSFPILFHNSGLLCGPRVFFPSGYIQ